MPQLFVDEVVKVEKTPILLVDDKESNLVALAALLSEPTYQLIQASSAEEALQKLARQEVAVILSDVRMPGIDGFEFAVLARKIPSAQDTPIIFLTGDGDGGSRIQRAYLSGAVDYLEKPLEPAIVRAKVAVFVRLFRQRLFIADQARQLYETANELIRTQALAREHEEAEKEIRVKREAEARANELIRRNEETLRLAFQAGEVGRWSIDYREKRVHWSEEQEKIFGLAPGTFGGHVDDFLTRIHPADRENVLAKLQRVLQREDRLENEYRIIRPDGGVRWLISRGAMECDSDGHPRRARGIVMDVTRQMEAEQTLRLLNEQLQREINERRRVESHLRLITDALPALVAYIDPQHRYQFVNAPYQKLFDAQADGFRGRAIVDILGPKAYEKIRERLNRALSGETVSFEEHMHYENQKSCWMSATYVPDFDADGTVKGVVALAHDITEKRRAEDALRSSEERFRLMVEQVKDYGIITTDARGLVVDWNPSIERITGFSAEEMIGQDVALLFSPEDQAAGVPLGERNKARDMGRAEGLRWHVRKDGSRFWAKGFTNALRNKDGSLRGFSKILRDETENKRREDRQRTLEQFTQQIASSIDYESIVAYVADTLVPKLGDWCIVSVRDKGGNAAHDVLRHKDAQQIERLQRPADVAFRPDRPILIKAMNRQELESLSLGEASLSWLESLAAQTVMIVPLVNHGLQIGFIMVGAADRDDHYGYPDLILLEELALRGSLALENARLYFESKEANRLKDEFLAAVSHELRTPLNSILGYTDLLRDDSATASAEEIRSFLDVIHRNAMSQLRLVEDLLDISKIISGKMRLEIEPFDLKKVIQDAVSSVEVSARAKAITIRQQLDAAPPSVMLDPFRIQQIVWNLLSNAVKFSSMRGSIDIIVRCRAGRLEIEVNDTGKGIDSSFLPFVFDRFRQEDGSLTRLSGGLGLGLAISRQLAELHGGRIEARSPGVGKGASFLVSLPLTACKESNEKAEDAILSGKPLEKRRILLLDDNLDARALMSVALQRAGAVVIVPQSPDEAFELSQKETFDAFLCDISMPGEDGYSLIGRIRAAERQRQAEPMTAIAVTAHANESSRAHALASGFQSFLTKPFAPSALLETLILSMSR